MWAVVFLFNLYIPGRVNTEKYGNVVSVPFPFTVCIQKLCNMDIYEENSSSSLDICVQPRVHEDN